MKRVLITGAGSGLGAALAESYVQAGAFVILVGRSIEKLQKIAGLIDTAGNNTASYRLDVSNVDSIKSFKTTVEENHEEIDILINCAGVGYFGPLVEMTRKELEAMFQVNTFGTIYMTQQFIPIVRERIINIISTAGLKGKVNESVYVASKFAVRGFTESLQKEYEDESIVITGVYMGGMATPFWDESTHIKDMSRLKSPKVIAEKIVSASDKIEELIL